MYLTCNVRGAVVSCFLPYLRAAGETGKSTKAIRYLPRTVRVARARARGTHGDEISANARPRTTLAAHEPGVLRKHRMNYFASAHDRQNYFARRGFIVATGLSTGGISDGVFTRRPCENSPHTRGINRRTLFSSAFEASFLF